MHEHTQLRIQNEVQGLGRTFKREGVSFISFRSVPLDGPVSAPWGAHSFPPMKIREVSVEATPELEPWPRMLCLKDPWWGIWGCKCPCDGPGRGSQEMFVHFLLPWRSLTGWGGAVTQSPWALTYPQWLALSPAHTHTWLQNTPRASWKSVN